MPGFLKAVREAAAAAPVKKNLVFTKRELWDDIERTLWALETAQNHFEQATEPSPIDCYIYEWNAAQLRYQFLLRKFKTWRTDNMSTWYEQAIFLSYVSFGE